MGNVKGRFLMGEYGILTTLCGVEIGYILDTENKKCADCDMDDLTTEIMEVSYFKSYLNENGIRLAHKLLVEIYCEQCHTKLLDYNEFKWKSLFSLKKIQGKLKEPTQ